MVEHLPYSRGCFVCGVENTNGFGMRFHADAEAVHAEFTPGQQHAGYPGLLHGGAIAAILDEAMFWAATHGSGRMHVSVDLSVRYRSKVSVGEPHRVEARLVLARGPVCKTEASLLDAAGAVCVTATGKFMPLPPEEVPHVLADFFPDPETVDPERYVLDAP